MAYPYTYGYQQPMQQNGMSSASRAVSSREEAIAAPADFSGSPMIFPDLSHGRIYLKRFNLQTGAPEFIEFSPVEPPKPEQVKFVTEDVFFSELKKIREELKGGAADE